MSINIMEKSIVIDFHAHILPDMDHGCTDTEMSLKQLKMAAEAGIDIIIASSHFYPHMENVESFLGRRKEAFGSLEAAGIREKPLIKLGAEVLACKNIDQMEGLERLCIENSRVLLLEMPFTKQWDSKLLATVLRLREEKGLEVILAHGERYPAAELQKLLEKGFMLQLNVASLAGLLPSASVRRYMREHRVAAFGSDIHGLHDYYKDFGRAMKKWGVEAEQVMEHTGRLIGVL